MKILISKVREFSGVSLVVALTIVLFLVNVFVAILSSSRGAEVVENERELAELVRENRSIQSRISEESSLTKLQEQMEELGFGKPEKIIYYNTEKPFALR